MGYIHGTATKMNFCIDNAQHRLIIDHGSPCFIVARDYMDNNFQDWKKQLSPTKAKNFKSASGKIKYIGKIIKEIIIPHRKHNIRLNPNKNRHITIGTKKEKKFSLAIYQISVQNLLEELLNEFREGQFSNVLTSKEKLSLLKMLRKNTPAFAIGEESIENISGHYIELYLYVERPYTPILTRPPFPASLETRKEIEKNITELLDMDAIRKIVHNEIVEITTPLLISWNNGKSTFCGDSRALNNYTKADRYSIPRIPHALDKLKKAKYITKMDSPKKIRDSILGPFTITKLIGSNAVEVKITEEFWRKHPVFQVSLVKPYFQTEEDKFPSRKKPHPNRDSGSGRPPGPVRKIIKARKIRLNGKDQRHYLVRFKNQTADKGKCLAKDSIPDGNLHLRRLRASRRTEKSHQ
ncbi:hypothetical protein O181_045676 [Austropuccinia psidii MF-1]|uniref:Reverse transcriptase domain-containing protein n=1 Tax=Austropuccinia psidii MF-1 TaxID=1389203 RepID=A0A9Q3HHY9_9BASI|nr:hypothetical protein [Austropuccinia psidii MF-1]